MTDQTTTEDQAEATGTQEQATGDQTTTEATGDQDAQGNQGNREAAKYRRQLREAEAARDALSTRLEGMQRAQVEAMVDLAQPRALWAVTELADLLDDDGNVDSEKVAAAMTRARDELGASTRDQPVFESPSTHRTNSAPPASEAFVQAFEPKR